MAAATLLLYWTTAACAGCPDNLLGGTPPRLPAGMVAKLHAICAEHFAAAESGVTRTGLWSAEHLTRAALEAAARRTRVNKFHAAPGIPFEDRAELSDYKGSGLDRGHLTPDGDEPDESSAYSTFSLGQMIPQAPENNRKIWEDIEATIRSLTRRDGETWIVTGALFRGDTLRVLNHRVYVPTHVYKAVYDPGTGHAGVYVTRNAPGHDYTLTSVDAFVVDTGIDPFPALTGPARASAEGMPAVERTKYDQGNE